MCGICGLAWNSSNSAVSLPEALRMTNVLQHRGPDDAWLFDSRYGMVRTFDEAAALNQRPVNESNGPGAFLGHRRLSIIDLSGGRQPLSNEDGSIWVAFNGEIYNYKELRDQLIAKGHQFTTSSDTEVIVHLYEERGHECVHELRGMFAIAIWDSRRERLFLARDRLGKKPLVYRHDGQRLAFASELKSLLQISGAPREVDPEAVNLYLAYQYVPHPHSILKGYAKLPPAHWAIYENGNLRVERYWHPPYEPGSSAELLSSPEDESTSEFAGSERWSAQQWQRKLRETLTEAVRLRMRSDVPLGAFLSGGIDSTIISGLMQEQSTTPVHTFSIGFPVKRFDEREYARAASQHLGTQHHEMVVEPAALSILPKLIWHYDEPFSDSSAIPTMYLSELTRREVTVSLSGDGGDELFCGYERYKAVKLATMFDRLPWPIRKLMTSPLWQKLPARADRPSLRRKAKRFAAAYGQPPERRYMRWVCIFDDKLRNELLHPDFAAQLGQHDPTSFLEECYRECPSRDFITRTTCTDVLSYLPCDIMNKVDIASMAYALECRCPFLDQRVVELAARMPIELKLHGQQGKQILIDTFRDLLPESIQHRGKMGFGVPLDHWFRNELKPLLADVLLDPRSLQRGWFRPEAVQQLCNDHFSGKLDQSYRLWNLLVFELWQQAFIDSPTPPSGAAA